MTSTILWIVTAIIWLVVGILNFRKEYVERPIFIGTWLGLMIAVLYIITEKVM